MLLLLWNDSKEGQIFGTIVDQRMSLTFQTVVAVPCLQWLFHAFTDSLAGTAEDEDDFAAGVMAVHADRCSGFEL